MGKKKLMEDALLEAKELEDAAIENAKNMVVEAFNPQFVDLFKDVLTEEYDVDDMELDPEKDEDEDDIEEGTEHDMGKEPDAGRDDTDAATAGDDTIKEEWDATDAASGKKPEGISDEEWKAKDATTGRSTKNIQSDEWEAVHKGEKHDPGKKEIEGTRVADTDASGMQPTPDTPDPGKQEHIDGEKVANKKEGSVQPTPETPDPGKMEDELYEAALALDEADMDIPDELFDDEEDDVEGKDKEDNVDLSSDLEDDEKEQPTSADDDEESVDIDIEDDEEVEGGEDADSVMPDSEDEEFEEGLYVRKEGEFKKVTPTEYLQTRISELSEENEKLQGALVALQGQLRESNVFNAKLAYVNKLYNSGLFNSAEKESIAERIDECEDIDEVKGLYKIIVTEVKDKNPLDAFSNKIKETRANAAKKPQNIFESPEMMRMRRNAGLLQEDN